MKSFLNACGFREPLRLVIEGPRAAEAEPRPLPHPFAVLGRDHRADVVLDDLKVSRRHVYLQAVAGQLFWIDLESRTGTCDETGTRKWGWLTGGGLLQIGPFVVRRAATAAGALAGDLSLRESSRESPVAVRSYGRESLPEVALEFLNGPSQATVWPMNRVMSLVGSAQGCKFRLTDPSVSAFHACLLRTAPGLWVVDVRGGRSITINSEPVRFGPLADGDLLGIGRYRIQIRCRESRAEDRDLNREASSEWATHRLSGGGPLARRPVAGAVPALSAFTGSSLPKPASPTPVVASAAGVEVIASESILPGRLHPEITDSVLVPLVNQFSMMQQQMFDQFQQAMGMMLQMFGSMHREQMEVIREELDRLHELTRELQELKEELAKSPGRQAPAPSLAEPVATTVPPAVAPISPAAAVQSQAWLKPGAANDRRPVEAPVGSTGQSARTAPAEMPSGEIPIPPPSASGPRWPTDPVVAPSSQPSRPAPAPAPPSAGPRPDHRLSGTGSSGTAGGPGAVGTPQDSVAWIHQRIAAIQQERETRWQKILKVLPGMS